MAAYWILLASLAFIIFVEGLLNPFWIWNAIPLGLAALLVYNARRRAATLIPALAFGVGAVGIPVYTHLAWLFDWDQLATGSSTAGIIFIFIPIIARVAGAVLYVVARVVLMLRRR